MAKLTRRLGDDKYIVPQESDFPPRKWRHFEDPKTPLRHTGSNPSIGGSLGILRVGKIKYTVYICFSCAR